LPEVIDVKRVFFVFYKSFINMFCVFYFFIVVFFVRVKHPHTDMMHFLQQIAVSHFSIRNIQYFSVFTAVGLSKISTTVRGTLI